MLKRLTAHHIESYDKFLFFDIPTIVAQDKIIKAANFTVKFKKIIYNKPKLTPLEAKQKDLTYSISIDYEIDFNGKSVVLEIFSLPLMLKSKLCLTCEEGETFELCPNDPGGYFIVKGKERVLIPHIRPRYNVPMIKYEDGIYLCEFRSASENGNSTLIQAKTDGKIILEFSLPYIKQFVPAGTVFKTLGISFEQAFLLCGLGQRDKEGCLTCKPGYYESLSTILHRHYTKNKTVTDYVPLNVKCDDKESYVEAILKKEIFNHLEDHSPFNVARHLGYMVDRLATIASGEAALTDKDDLAYKRVDTSGVLIEFLFKGLFKQYVRLIRNSLETLKNPDPINVVKNVNVITNGLNLCFATGNWSVKKTGPPSYMRVGVSQVLCNHNYGSRLSHLRRLMHAVGFKGKNFKIRRLHASHYGFICPYETPEGERVGVVLNTALSTAFSQGIPKNQIKPLMMPYLKESGYFRVVLNGEIVGYVNDPNETVKLLKSVLPDGVSVFCFRFTPEIKECHVFSDQGRFLRPVLINDKIVRVCAQEIHHIAYKELPAYSIMTDVMASVIPFYNHAPSPRIAYQSNMGKQAVGITTLTGGKDRYDPTFYVLDYPQKALARTICYDRYKFDIMCHGAIPIVAVSTMDGYNQEDSVILNKSSVDRGLFVITCYKTFVETEKYKSKHDSELIAHPDFLIRNRDLDYGLLGKTGVLDIKLGKKNKKYQGSICNSLWIPAGTVLVGKVSKKLIDGVIVYKDVSLTVKADEEGYLDELLDYYMVETGRVVKIKLRSSKIPEIGDKFASFTAQKGTCGMIYRQEDMPFTKDGIVPDLIINPHAFPSRMTLNYILQMCYGLAACKTGKIYDATPFKRYNLTDELRELALELKLETWETTMYCGLTGKKFASKIFIGPCDYQRLRHLVTNKIHSRISGPIDNLTHQPVAGRSRYGGIKVGEMEQWCKLSHGASAALKESLFDMSDKYTIPICKTCKTISDDFEYCRKCDDIEIELKNCPYTSKLLFQELMAIGIHVQFE